MKSKLIFFLLTFIFVLNANAYSGQTEILFYLTPDRDNSTFSAERLSQIKNQAHHMNIVAPQIYRLDENGVISGTIDPNLLSVAKENHLKIIPLIMNPDFNKEQFHLFLSNKIAQETAISNMASLCKQYGFNGLQFDFENIDISDKDAFTNFYQATAKQLHALNFSISIAVVPRAQDIALTDYEKWYFTNWSGVYDYQVLGENSDFMSVMSYDQHTNLTTPGPIAAIDWVEKTIQTLLTVVPANKISLGVPDYSGYWSTGKLDPGGIPEKYTYRSKERQISYSIVLDILKQANQSTIWQEQWQSSYAMFSNRDKLEYLFIEDAHAFQAKLDLAKRYQLRGISVWKFGLEDPAIWEILDTNI